jgi:hypothetical protein
MTRLCVGRNGLVTFRNARHFFPLSNVPIAEPGGVSGLKEIGTSIVR